MKVIHTFFTGFIFAIFILIIIAKMTWEINNPIANNMTFFTHFNDVIHFRSLPEFQKEIR